MEEFLSEHKGAVSTGLSLLAALIIAYAVYLVWIAKGDTRFDLFFFVNVDRGTALFILIAGPIAAIFATIAAWFLIKLAYNLIHSGVMRFCPPNASEVISWLVIIAAIAPVMTQAKAIKTFALTASAQTNLLIKITKSGGATDNNSLMKTLIIEANKDILSGLPQDPGEAGAEPIPPPQQQQEPGVISFTPGD